MNKVRLEEIVKKVDKIPAFSETVVRLLKMMDDPEVKVHDIKQIINRDQGLTTKILRVANSAFYRGRREIKTVDDAIILLGLKTVKAMIFATSVGPIMEKELKGYDLEKRALWEQSQISAIMCRLLAKKVHYDNPELAYTAGLLKDVGKVILDEYVQEENQRILAIAEQQNRPFTEVEEEVLGFNHAEIGYRIAEKWRLPNELCEVIACHHVPQEAIISPKLAMICHLSDSLIMMMGIHIGIDGLAYEFYSEALDILELDEAAVSEIMSEVAEFVGNKDTYF